MKERETHTKPFRKKRLNDKKREKGDKLLLHTFSLRSLKICLSRIITTTKRVKFYLYGLKFENICFLLSPSPSLFPFFLKEKALCLMAIFEMMTFVTKEIQGFDIKTKRGSTSTTFS